MADARPILADYARAGWHLVPIPQGQKGPVTHGWQRKELCIVEPEIAEWIDGNVGLAHAYSGTCAVDIDNPDAARAWLADRQVDMDALLAAPDAVRIESNRGRAKLIYRLTKPLPSFKLPGLELRCGNAAHTTVQDVLPPSIHPETGKPYEWRYNTLGAHWSKLPDLPGHLLSLWASLIAPTAPKAPRPPREVGATAEKLRALLAGWDPDIGYDDWLKVGMALHHETNGATLGLMVWNEWSSKGKKYQSLGDLEVHWRSFRIDHDRPVTLASLRRDTAAALEEFEDLTTEAPAGETAPAGSPSATAQAGSQSRLTGPAREMALQALRSVKRTEKGKIEAIISNIVTVLSVPEVCGYDLALDEFQDVILLSPQGGEQWRPLTDNDYTQLRVWLETAGNCQPVPHEMMRHALHLVADRHRMDSAQRWIESLVWDGVERIEHFCYRYFGAEECKYTRAVGLYLWTALAGRIVTPGCQCDMAPVFIGDQGIGKSQGVKAMVPAPEHFAELHLDDNDDEIARRMRGVLVAELAELRGLRGADQDRVKAFVTRSHEKWVPKYKEFATNYARRFIIVGTTNEEEFLPSDDAHRRWLPVHTGVVDVASIRRDCLQLWAEAYLRYSVDGVSWQGMDMLAADAREAAMSEDPWTDEVVSWLASDERQKVRTHDILRNAIGADPRNVTRVQELRVGRIMRALGYVRTTQRVDGRLHKVWVTAS